VIRQLGHLGGGQSLLRALSVGERMCLRHGPSGLVVSRVRFASRGYPVGGFFGQVLGWVQHCRLRRPFPTARGEERSCPRRSQYLLPGH
jgi:hypothetical protein